MTPSLTIADMDAITLIVNDHRTVEDLFSRYEAGGDAQTRLRLAAKMIEELSVHAGMEEAALYPLVRDRLEDGEELYEEGMQEHREAKEVLAKLESTPVTDDSFDEQVRHLISEVRHHVQEEESELLPKLGAALGQEDLTALAEQLRDAKAQAPVRPVPGGDAAAGKTRDELYDEARQLGVEGRSDMTKEELAHSVAEERR